MSTVRTFIRLAGMRRRAGGSALVSLRWASGLLWRNHQTTRRNKRRIASAKHVLVIRSNPSPLDSSPAKSHRNPQ